MSEETTRDPDPMGTFAGGVSVTLPGVPAQYGRGAAYWQERAEHARAELAFVRVVLVLFAKADTQSDLWWQECDGEIQLSANVSDAFVWGCADTEAITPERLPILKQAYDDLLAVHGTEHLAVLYGARIRKMRPQGAAFPKETPIAELFNACGPARAVGLGNPKPQPDPSS